MESSKELMTIEYSHHRPRERSRPRHVEETEEEFVRRLVIGFYLSLPSGELPDADAIEQEVADVLASLDSDPIPDSFDITEESSRLGKLFDLPSLFAQN